MSIVAQIYNSSTNKRIINKSFYCAIIYILIRILFTIILSLHDGGWVIITCSIEVSSWNRNLDDDDGGRHVRVQNRSEKDDMGAQAATFVQGILL